MQVIDLSHTIREDMPVYPGTQPPSLQPGSTYEEDGFRETILTLFSHTGTHMDAPNHLFFDRPTLDTLPVSCFTGSAVVIDCTHKQAGESIGLADLQDDWAAVEQAEFLLFHTGWSRFWGQSEYFGDYPCLDFDVLDYLVSARKKGVGLDVIGLDPIADTNLTRHKRLFQNSPTLVIENLCHLDQIGAGFVTFTALPLKFLHADGAPVRAVAFLP